MKAETHDVYEVEIVNKTRQTIFAKWTYVGPFLLFWNKRRYSISKIEPKVTCLAFTNTRLCFLIFRIV